MIKDQVLIDTNIFLLLVAGVTNRNIIENHKRINQITIDDFELLEETLGPNPKLILLPNVVTEAGNLIIQTNEPNRSKLLIMLAAFVQSNEEVYVESGIATKYRDFRRLGITDCALLSTDTARFHLLTVDFDLYDAFLRARRPATNFRHVIESRA